MKKYLLLLTVTLILASCTTNPQDTRRKITVTIEPLRYFTEQIAGEKFVVNTMVPQGGNPETYEPTAQQMVKLAESDLYIKVGNIGFERTWMKKLSQNAPHTIIIDSSEGIELAHSSHGVTDPHTWMSTNNAKQIARNIYEALVSINARDSASYRRNYEALIDTIEATDMRLREQLTRDKSQAFLIDHPALTYFARDYELLQIPVEEEGREPSAAQLKKTIQLAKDKKVKVMFVQKQFETRSTKIVSQEVGAETIAINPLSHNWSEEMVSIAKKLK
ncbi:zinc ABC transporter substrate-binding protein [Hoylesella buccalis]|uniref:metal ABC transporter solute-binding protein, Zn/Mn family n=1 Tax=Hoylesella buccalis TaxID=28127 RepID=UPI001D0654B4|nr:zinc ABC transporter substrate-binding protein [Hoylesella buccalis]MCB6901263.1 zinc ABC transporter substrate-binding protein [Hoylesella buccalis]UEA62927.1 zinc ABC transporter substrate-binding protein [Hoylesella buccalis]UWP49785.1 zinc ABC transporter substrate-binding protein [Hoylesella buccalis ATCC 35310]